MNDTQDVLDVRGRNCPLPVLDICRQLKHLDPGATLCVVTSDSGSPRNFRAFCRQSGHEFVEVRPQGEDTAIYIRKANRSC
ncbi:MAG: sulfurtransferase TusA family protein [Hydrogenophilaceae bacterium]|nr:sulfurtransferase TusA family protein [Hydrogenophilaceae bacterium]